jgi:hypothetical protein
MTWALAGQFRPVLGTFGSTEVLGSDVTVGFVSVIVGVVASDMVTLTGTGSPLAVTQYRCF